MHGELAYRLFSWVHVGLEVMLRQNIDVDEYIACSVRRKMSIASPVSILMLCLSYYAQSIYPMYLSYSFSC